MIVQAVQGSGLRIAPDATAGSRSYGPPADRRVYWYR